VVLFFRHIKILNRSNFLHLIRIVKLAFVINLAVDFGNSRIKAGLFEGETLKEKLSFMQMRELEKWLGQRHDNLIVSSVSDEVTKILTEAKSKGKKVQLTTSTSLPIKVKYDTPETLGVDRLAAACGALQLFPGHPCLVIDMGTCINYEVLDSDAVYWGGIISPGVSMRFKAMHTFTARLPLIEPVGGVQLIGNSTKTCMQSGVMNGILEEMRGIMNQLRLKYPNLRVILCGGDAGLFENQLKDSIFAAPELVLRGLNRILNHNVSI
jgi:type III pantothenate kinase